ncbi:hypothetical protein HIM_09250 [Hirsutella minnesotensis 3608]|uniref:Uncharacterized protein n=1 Tax=Hirsutella minnesotensis 3608 TaxID=1043627 RepID=A0A0F7ZXV2_9HYPO|nr:hypothetical protein HIM_09250 [Hirsutella minnesotensis 3608]
MEFITSALGPIQGLLWGERAMAALGVRLVCEHYMIVIRDADFDDAVQRLRSAGFENWPWSYGSLEPNFYQGRLKENIYRHIVKDFADLDKNSARFLFPSEKQMTAKVALLPSSYAHIRFDSATESAVSRNGNILYPNAAVLLQSVVQTLIREPVDGMWASALNMWAISYIYGQLMLGDDVLDECDDDGARDWFNESIQRSGKGIDRITCTKRLGRVGYDENLARVP